MTQAVRERASDVHIEPQDDAVRVRFRVDGALHDVTRLPIGIAQALVSRLKIMADMNIVERRRSQDGQFEIEVDGRSLDVRSPPPPRSGARRPCCASSTRAGHSCSSGASAWPTTHAPTSPS
jgi:type IV pilus assembly protein PilB